MLNFNNIPEAPSSNNTEFELIPDNTIVRGVLKLTGGDVVLPEFGNTQCFKRSQSGAEWLPVELTIMGGQFDKRKVWQNIFVNGAAVNEQGVSKAKIIGLNTIKSMIDSNFNLDPKDQSPAAQQSRSLNDIGQLNGMNICFKIGIEKGNNGYADKNKIKSVLTLGQNGYLPTGQAPQAPVQQPAQPAAAPATDQNGVVPSWAQ